MYSSVALCRLVDSSVKEVIVVYNNTLLSFDEDVMFPCYDFKREMWINCYELYRDYNISFQELFQYVNG